MRSSCSSSPSTIIWVSPISRSSTWKLRSRSATWNASMYSQSPASTEVWLPHCALAEGRPRRVRASSITSSCTSVAAWMISTTAPRWMALSPARPFPPISFEASSSSDGRSRLPPLSCRYWPIWVTTSTDATVSRLISFSTRSRSSWIRSKISLPVMACPSLPKFIGSYSLAAAVRSSQWSPRQCAPARRRGPRPAGARSPP